MLADLEPTLGEQSPALPEGNGVEPGRSLEPSRHRCPVGSTRVSACGQQNGFGCWALAGGQAAEQARGVPVAPLRQRVDHFLERIACRDVEGTRVCAQKGDEEKARYVEFPTMHRA